MACSVDMPAPCRVRVDLRDPRRTLFSFTDTVQVGSYLDFSAIVDRSERRSLRGRDYTLRLEGTDAAGARVVIEERDLRAG